MSISNLITRLEGMTGPDREVDAEIACLVYALPLKRPNPAKFVANKFGYEHAPPAYTSSIDAAMTLVPEGFYWSVDGRGCAIVSTKHASSEAYGCALGNYQPAIALCIASLRARMSCDATQEAAE